MTDGSLTLQRPADGAAALAVALDWLRVADWTDEFEALALRPLDASGAPDTLAQHLAEAGLVDWHDAIIDAAGPGQPLHLDPRLAWLMGQTALEVAVGTDHPGLFRVVEDLQMLGEVNNETLASAVCIRIAGASEDHPILARLGARLQMQWDSQINERLRRYAEATAARPLTSRDIWAPHDGMPVGDGWAHRVAATLWPARYMEMLASFPVPFQHGFGDPLSPVDLEMVASLVRASPTVFSHDGVPLGPVVVFVLLDAVETKLATVDAQGVAAAEIALDNILDSVFSRSDGDWIGRAWLQQVVWRNTPRRAGRSQHDVSVQRALRDTLLGRLSARITSLGAAVFAWVRQEEPLWGVDRVLSEASILVAHGDAAGASEILAGAIRQGLVSATGRAAGLVTGSPEATIVAGVLAQLPDMLQWFELLWRDTYELREHLSYQAHRDLDNPAYPALAWGLIGLNASGNLPVDQARAWRAIAAAVFETQRIDPNAYLFNGAMPPITRVAVQLGAALVACDTLPIGDFANFLADQIEPTVEHARLWQIVMSTASEAVALAAGRLVGAGLLRQALEAGLAQNLPAWDAALDGSARIGLANLLRIL